MTKRREVDPIHGGLRLTFNRTDDNTADATFSGGLIGGFFRVPQQIGGDILRIDISSADDQRPIEKGVHLAVHCFETERRDYTGRFVLGIQLNRDVARELAEAILRNSYATIVVGDCETPWRGRDSS